ncbi:uncharacterized protein LOC131939627 [Physella acuta]|uniref:uncharacterized protein LOC131939627 n=1 Tax=Physella acuta TaxID=109671 RepID=UPI0027DC1FC6|nr:uncharacterized protein LOC131939627 [Physella acuta]
MEVFDGAALAEQMGIGQAEFMEIWHREESLKLMNQGVLNLGNTAYKDLHTQPEKNGIMAVLEHHSWELCHLNVLIQELKYNSVCQKSDQAFVNANIEQQVQHHSQELHVLKAEVDNIKSSITSLRREVFSQLEKVFKKLKESELSTKETVKPNQAPSLPVKDNQMTASSVVSNNGRAQVSQEVKRSSLSSSHSTDDDSSMVSVNSFSLPLPGTGSENFAVSRTNNLSFEKSDINATNDSNNKVNSQHTVLIANSQVIQKVTPKCLASKQSNDVPLQFIGDVNTKAMESCATKEIITPQFGAGIWKKETSQPNQNVKTSDKGLAHQVTSVSQHVPQPVPQKVSSTTAPQSKPASASTHSSQSLNSVSTINVPQLALKSSHATIASNSASSTSVVQPPVKSTYLLKAPNSVPQSAIKSTDPSTAPNSVTVPQSAVKSNQPTKPTNSLPQPLFIPSDGIITKIPESHLFYNTQEDFLTPYYLTSKLTCKIRLRLQLDKTSRRLHVYVHISATPKVELPIYLTGTGYISAKVSGGSGFSELWQVYSRLSQRPEPGKELVTEARVCLKTKRNTYKNITFDQLISMGYGCERFLVVKWDLAASTDINQQQ